jgi:hypothetical protein
MQGWLAPKQEALVSKAQSVFNRSMPKSFSDLSSSSNVDVRQENKP